MDYSVKNITFKAYGYTVPRYDKERNGDPLCLVDMEEEKTLITIVADGVSNQPCDWISSKHF